MSRSPNSTAKYQNCKVGRHHSDSNQRHHSCVWV